MRRWARTFLPSAAALALVVPVGCGGEALSPTAPVAVNSAAPGDAVWFDPAYSTFYVDANHDAILVDVDDRTQFVGFLRSVREMSVVYEMGRRVKVSVNGVEVPGATPRRLLASSVAAQAFDTYLTPLPYGGGSDPRRVGYSEPQFNRLVFTDGGRWEVFFTRSTIFDPTGDFTTFDDLIAAMERDEVKYLSGEGWQVAEVGQLARTMKATRQPQ